MLKVRDLRAGFAGASTLLTAVDGVSFDLAAGETLALLGESGCGKSATALALLRLLPAAGRILGGEARFDGRDLLRLPESEMRAVRGGGMAMIFQEPATSLNPVMTVGRQIGEALARHLSLTGAAAAVRARELLESVGIADAERRLSEYPFQFSGGMKQRVMIAIALAGNPRLLIADEPTTALDVTIQAQILDLLCRLQEERGMGILLISHDLGVVARLAHRVAVMYAGRIVEEAPRALFFTAPAHPYAQKLFQALPGRRRRGAPLSTIPGQVPPLSALPQACRFAPRCEKALPVCHETAPEWVDLGGAHRVACHRLPLALSGGAAEKALEEQSPEVARPLPAAPVLSVGDLRVHFPIRRGFFQRIVGQVRAVDGVSLALSRGKTLALVGESGCGKATVGKAILKLVPATAGEVLLGDLPLSALSRRAMRPLRRRIQMIFQDPFASLDPRMPVGEIIAEGMRALGVREETAALPEAIAALLAQVGLEAAAMHRYPHEFSGGQRQRIAIARALAVSPEILVCDEPTSALDVSVQAQILNLLKSLQEELELSCLFITHNFAVVEYIADEAAVMYLGRIVEQGAVDEVLRAPRHPYTQALLSAVPAPTIEAPKARIRLAGETPSPAHPPRGCHFHPRCPHALPRCREGYPETTRLSPSHTAACHLLS